MTSRRKYDDACGMAFGLEMLGERWALFIVRELMLGPRRFGDLRSDLPGLSANILTQRLAELEARGIVERSTLPPPANVQVYGLTEWGLLAEPIVQEIGRWAARSPHHDPTLPISPVSILISFRTMIAPDLARGLALIVSFRFGPLDYRADIRDGAITLHREPAPEADIRFSGTAPGLAAFVYGKAPLDQLAAAGLLEASGDPALLEQFRALFVLPPKIAPQQ